MKITMTYSGKDVDDGTIKVEDIAPALQGFVNLYSKIASYKNIKEKHELRISAVSKGSFVVDINVFAGHIKEAILPLLPLINDIGTSVVTALFIELIKLKKHIKKENIEKKIDPVSKNVTITNKNNENIIVNMDTYNFFVNAKDINNDFAKIVNPLEKDKIDLFKIESKNKKEYLKEDINYDEKDYFLDKTEEITSTKEIYLHGFLNTLTKSTNHGKFILDDKKKVPCELVMETPERYYGFFASTRVRIYCVAFFDKNLTITRIQIKNIENPQDDLPLI